MLDRIYTFFNFLVYVGFIIDKYFKIMLDFAEKCGIYNN